MRVRVTAEEETAILRNGKLSGFRTASDFLRHLALGKKVITRQALVISDMDFLLKLKGEIGKLGSNVNQIARAINQDRLHGHAISVPDTVIEQAMHSVDTAMEHLLELLGYGT